MFTNLRELILSMPTEQMCREYVAKQRWADGNIVCPYCNHSKCYVIENGERYKCADKNCHKRFRVTVGTIMEASKIPLTKWLTAIYLVSAHKKGISSYQLGRDLGIAQKNAWFMLHRIREMFRDKTNEKLNNIVEVDEVYIGGKVGNMSKTKRKKLREDGNTYGTKTMVMGMLERDGKLKLIPLGSSNNMSAIQPLVRQNVNKEATLITDSLASYNGLDKDFAKHEIVNHTGNEFVRGNIHTNSIEGAFSMLRRSIIGIYHKVTPKHLDRYCHETMFRYNLRKMTDTNRFTYSLTNVEGRLTYKELIATKEIEHYHYEKNIPVKGKQGRKRAVYQIKDGEIIARYNSIIEAAKAIGVESSTLRGVLRGKSHISGGFHWAFA